MTGPHPVEAPETVDDKLVVLQLFFEKQVESYILKDLQKLADIKIDADGGGGCTVPLATSIISAIEMFGTLMHYPYKENRGRDAFLDFLKVYIPEFNADAVEVYRNYRNGMMHVFFPKANIHATYGVTKRPRDPNTLLDKTNPKYPILNVPLLHRYFKRSVEQLKNEIFINKDLSRIDPVYLNTKPIKSSTVPGPNDTTRMDR